MSFGKGIWCGLFSFSAMVQPVAAGEIIHGPDAQAAFEGWRDSLGDIHVTFDEPEAVNGPLAPLDVSGVTLTFATTQQRYPSLVDVDYPVVVLPYSFVSSTHNGTNTLMGTRSSGGLPDGQSRYEIAFSEPQARVGLLRLWNTSSLTRFFNESGELLGEHQNTEPTEFVGWVADGPERAQWVSKVVMDGLNPGGTYQVGEADDLFFGTAPLEDSGMIGIIYGTEAEEAFTLYRELLNDVLVDFDNLAKGPHRSIDAGNGEDELTLATTEKRYPQPSVAVDFPVSVLPYSYVSSTPSGTGELMGTGSSAGVPDGQNRYEIVFSRLQHRVGVMRRWNTSSVTRFYAADGSVLGEHQNTVNHEFVGWVGDPGEPATWVKKVEMDGVFFSGAFQVGFSDNLHFGRELPDNDPMQVTSFIMSAEHQVTLNWWPGQLLHKVEVSVDLHNWEAAGGDLNPTSWTGTVEGDPARIYYRVLTEKLFRK